MRKATSLVETSWLHDNLESEDIAVLDCSWHLPGTGRNGRDEFDRCHIPRAQFFDIDEVSDPQSSYPHMLPSAQFFSEKVAKLGITNRSHIIVYDSLGLFSAARVWWMFRIFGHERVSILNGGLKKWLADGLSSSDIVKKPIITVKYEAKLNPDQIIDYENLLEVLSAHNSLILDARPPGRFKGEDPEPRAELSSGHMPGSTNLPISQLLQDDGRFRPIEEIRSVFESAGLKDAKPVITSCGSGVTAAVLSFGLHLLGCEDVKLFDGSWSEYASRDQSEIIKD